MKVLPTLADTQRRRRIRKTKDFSKVSLFGGMAVVLLLALTSPVFSREFQIMQIEMEKKEYASDQPVEVSIRNYKPNDLKVFIDIEGEMLSVDDVYQYHNF